MRHHSGIKGTTNVMYMNKKFVAQHSVAAQNFIRADIRALDYCVKNRAACVKTLPTVATSNGAGATDGVAQNTPVWKYQANTVKAKGTRPLGTFNAQLWEPEYKLLKILEKSTRSLGSATQR